MERLSLKSVNGEKMMKKIFLLLCMVLYNLYCFAADYRVIKDSKLYDGNYYYRGNIKKERSFNYGILLFQMVLI